MNQLDMDKNDYREPSKFDLSVSVLNSEENWIQLPGFEITVTQAIALIIEKLKLPVEAEDKIKLKYFLFYRSERSDDGYEILAEYDKHGSPVILSEYGITNGMKLNIGAIVLPATGPEIRFRTNDNTPGGENDDDTIFEI